ncbi:hypothetical protein CCR75_002272 [Bremia lactucae]|uniref:Uncharacterized protein n=1 Tax=Bremia lactucae TaxID=4779 RepID=A0A976IF30_BRELC|nr:hypothetical protein CCR75_002272 [Bremia lactucae]
MAFELLGYQKQSERLPAIRKGYLQDAIAANVPLHDGFHRTREIVRYCSKAVRRCGVEVNIAAFRKNLYDGCGAGLMAIVRRVLPESKGIRVLPPRVYLVCQYKRNMRAQWFAIKVTAEEDVIVRKDYVDSGIGDQTWLRTIKLIRHLVVHICGASNP